MSQPLGLLPTTDVSEGRKLLWKAHTELQREVKAGSSRVLQAVQATLRAASVVVVVTVRPESQREEERG